MQSHDEGPRPDVIGKPGEADEDDGGHVVDDLFLEVLQKRRRLQGTFFCSPAPTMPSSSPSLVVPHIPQLPPGHPEILVEATHHSFVLASRLNGTAPRPTFRLTSEAILKSRDQ